MWNIYLDEDACDTDSNLLNELIQHEGFQGKSLGIVLISGNNKCKLCGGNLLVRADRPSFPVVYSNDLGTVSGTHFRKYCQNNWKGCPFTQHYGFHTEGNESEVVYDDDFSQLPYLSHHSWLCSKQSCWATLLLRCYWDKSHTDRDLKSSTMFMDTIQPKTEHAGYSTWMWRERDQCPQVYI